MINIREPLKTTIKPPAPKVSDALYERVIANYSVATNAINGEELLHMVTAPPEIYLAEGEQTSIVNNTAITGKKEENIEIINNFINRILVSADAKLTYQDRVFVSSVLHKLGIKNDARFMKEVNRFYDNTKNTNQLIELYESYAPRLQSFINEYKTISREGEPKGEDGAAKREELTLHKDIFNRLFTESYGDIVNKFNYNNFNNTGISSTELNLTRFQELSKSLYLNSLQARVRQEEVPLYYRQDNYYEDTALDITREGDTNIEQSLVSSVALELIKRAYITREGDLHKSLAANYDLRSSLNHSVDTLLEDFRQRIDNFLSGNTYIRDNISQDNRSYTRELNIINSILSQRQGDLVHLSPKGPDEGINDAALLNRQDREPDYEGLSHSRETIDISHVYNSVDDWEEPYLPLEHTPLPENVTMEELRRIDRQNTINQNRYIERLNTLTEKIVPLPRDMENTIERSRREALAAISDPKGAELTFKKEAREIQDRERAIREASYEALPEVTKQIFNQVSEYLKLGRDTGLQGNTQGSIARLASDINIINRDRERAELILNDNRETVIETVKEFSQRLSQEGSKGDGSPAQSRHITSQSKVDLFHRHQENTIDEELLEELRQQRNLLSRKDITTQEVTQSSGTTTTTVINNTTTQTIEENNRNIEELVRNSVRHQLGTITDKVYSRLERRLGNERSRRGF